MTGFGKNMENLESSDTLVQLLWKAAWKFLKHFSMELSHDSAITLLGISPVKNISVEILTNVCNGIIYNSPKDKLNVVYSYNKIVFSNKNKVFNYVTI